MNLPRIERTDIEGVLLVEPMRIDDVRGFFSESYNRAAFHEIGIRNEFVQDNHSLSRASGTIRGFHFQIAPFAQAKLVRVLRGAVCDVAVDLRRSSPTYGRSVTATLSSENGVQLFIPAGFGHAFCTLEPDTEVFYKIDAHYSREHERGLRWNDPALGIEWPVSESDATVLERDRAMPVLGDLPAFFP
jgi:dTDP-4-dehydrorhamnose 3,5-epimerase